MIRTLIQLCQFVARILLVSIVATLALAVAVRVDAEPGAYVVIGLAWLLAMVPALADYLDA